MELSSRKTSKRAIEPVDEWLQNEGYYRKHAPKDPTCLFRAVSEQVYQNQRCHIRVRLECVQFMKENRHMFEEKISIPYDSYLEQMTCFTEWGGMNEILAMSHLFKRNVVIFHGQKLTKDTVIDQGFKDSLFLCFTPPKQYETVYTQEYTANAGFCQSLVYQTLYKNVFKMNNIDATVHKMLHERSSNLRHDKFFLKGNVDIRNQLTLELFGKIEDNEDSEELQLLSKGITPFPYRVAKALDPNIYRNVDYDIWHEIRREVRNSGYTKFNSSELQAGAKCLVQIDLKDNDKANNNFLTAQENWDSNSKAMAKPKRLEPLFYTGHIQEMGKNEGPVLVFIEELGQKMTVPYEVLKPFPQRKVKQNNWGIASNKKNMIAQSTKWKKPWNSSGRRLKEQTPSDNVDKSQTGSSKAVPKNVGNKSEWNGELTSDNNNSGKLQTESYSSHKECSVNTSAENVRAVLENTHISTTDTAEVAATDKKGKNSCVNNDICDNSSNKQAVTNFNHDVNQSNKSNNSRSEKNEVFYPPYSNNPYSPSPRFPGDSEMVNYDLIKNLDMEGNDIPYSDPVTVRHFFNLGVKYFWSQNVWANGTNGQTFGDNSYYLTHPPTDMNMNTSMMNGSVSNGDNMGTTNILNGNARNNRTSPPRHRDQENANSNGIRQNGQKSNYRNSEFRNSAVSRDLHQSSNIDVNRNRVDYKNANESQQQMSNNKDTQRGNKSNGVAPRFKRNYEGRNRNDHHNMQHQYRQQHQQEYEARSNKKQIEAQVITNQCEMNEVVQVQQPQNPLQHQQQQQPQQQPPILPQTPPPLNNTYAYPMPYNQQVPYIPLSPYPPESEGFQGHYYPASPNFIQLPYMPTTAADMSDAGPIYPVPMDGMAQYPAVYPQYVYHPPATVYPSQPAPPPPPPPLPPTPAAPQMMPDNCYPAYSGQPYFFPYPPPTLPPSISPQSAPSH